MTTVSVTEATPDDIGPLLTSVAGLFREDSGRYDPLTDVGWPAREGAAYYSAMLGNPRCLVTLARDGDAVVGHLIGKLSGPGGALAGCVAILESMRVAPAARRTGVGSLLIEHFLAWARENDAQQASVTHYVANDPAERLYARHGFAPASTIRRALL